MQLSEGSISDRLGSSRFARIALCIFIAIATGTIAVSQRSRSPGGSKSTPGGRRRNDDQKILPSLTNIFPIDAPGKFSITAMSVEHSSAGRWYIPSYHDKNSAGWNRTVSAAILCSLLSCSSLLQISCSPDSLLREV